MSERERRAQVLLRVSDLERSLRFYGDLPGFRVDWREASRARLIDPGGTPLLLASDPSVPAPEGVPEAGTGAWVYLHRPELGALAQELTERGLPARGPVEPYPGYRHLLLEDPDGYWLVFWEPLPLTDREVLDLFRSGPERLERALSGLDEAGLDLPRAPGKWTIREILHHLVDSDLATFQVIRMALALPGRTITADIWEPDDWMRGLDCGRRPVGPAVRLFHAARDWLLEAVDHLPGALDRSVAWPSGYRAQVRDLLRQVGGHAIHHIIQIEETRRRYGR
ncbi:MAG: DinB family protein [Bacillota bacterium]